MTYGQKLRQEARIEGLQEGMAKGIFQVAKSMLKEGLAIHVIQKVTGLRQEKIDRLQPISL
jgi:predicted transposase/invertase (TIGR01784 family)